jgi:inorganic pyrophosphatase
MTARKRPTSAIPSQFRPHPWHGLDVGPSPPQVVNAFIEITPFDLVKYEMDKQSGYVHIDRPQRGSSQPPTLYGFIPRTYCGVHTQRLSKTSTRGDGDPLDICVLSERTITRGEIIVRARVVGGLQMVDSGEADDKIIAVLDKDFMWGDVREIRELPSVLIERLQHYFLTYKLVPNEERTVTIERIYGASHAFKVIEASRLDYDETFGGR